VLETLLRSMCAKRIGDRPRTYEILEELLAQALAACVAQRKERDATKLTSARALGGALALATCVPRREESTGAAPSNELLPATGGTRAPNEPRSALRDTPAPSPSPPANSKNESRPELRIVAVAVLALGFVAILVSTAAVSVAWNPNPPPSTAALTPLPVVTSLVTVHLPLLVSETAPAPSPGNDPPPEPQQPRRHARVAARSSAEPSTPSVNAPELHAEEPGSTSKPPISAIQARAQSMIYPPKNP
jgi:hypothetical protein